MIRISNEEMSQLIALIEKESGISYSINKKYIFETRLNRRLRELNLQSFSQYLSIVNDKVSGTKELRYLVNASTTNETSFYRHPQQLEALVSFVMPEAVETNKKAGKKKVKIWSAAASTGEEIYTIAMVLNEKFRMPPGWELELVASDINDAVLEAATEGLFSRHSLRNTDKAIIGKYFDLNGEYHKLRLDKLPKVTFRQMNLINMRPDPAIMDSDIVFCANVLIYFNLEAKIKAVENICRMMSPAGFFFPGHAETLHKLSKNFKLVNAAGVPVYRKG